MRRHAGITRIADISGLDGIGLPVVSVVRPNSRSMSVSSGKGTTDLEARVSGVMEALELFHAEEFSDWLPFGEVSHLAAAPDLGGFPKSVRPGGKCQTDSLPRMAVGYDLFSGVQAAVPFDLVHADFSTEAVRNNDGFLVSSNGLGGGSSSGEAIAHGLCEAIEGDAVALYRTSSPDSFSRVAWDSVEDPTVCRLLDACRIRGVSAAAWDITTDVMVPAFYCRLVERSKGPSSLASSTDGAGCHPDPAVALRRAFMEAIQTRVLLVSGARDDIRARFYSARNPAPEDRGTESRFPAETGCKSSADGMIGFILERLEDAGFSRAVTVDLKSKSPELAFARVVVPGLEGFPHSRGYRPGARATKARIRS
ncbi:ribosomal protein S12 methylthiotransferase accessory factor [Mesorhizobium robiniae]|uniref:Ribosomal protein S12 methylthiotransferase accessory factor n=1 Tax=Mesorhizobium robiniae TaxID=559315 RepID=A0ABV2GTU6_9HYPH